MNGDTTFLKARDLAERAGLPEADVKRFLRTYSEFFSSIKQGRTRMYPPGTVDLLKQIAELEAVGTTIPTIKGVLRRGQDGPEGQPDPGTVVPGGFSSSMGETLTLGVLSDIKNLQETVRDLQEEVASLRGKAGELEQKAIGHQQQIRLLRHDFDEQKTEILARRVEERSTPFWKRLFG
jgi:DNA-binding transcriptional MerR regulator